MPSKADLSGTTLPRRQLGKVLRDARQARGLTLDQVAAATGISRPTLSRIELGQYTKVREMEADFLGRYYGLPEARIQFLKSLVDQLSPKIWCKNGQHRPYPVFKTYTSLESYASNGWFHQSIAVPGLLQTADYARTLTRLADPDRPMDEIDAHVDSRMQRGRILTRPHLALRAEFLLQENVLYSLVGSGRIMAAQLQHVADMSTRDNISIRIVPFAAGIPAGVLLTPHIILEFPDNEPPIVYTEALMTSVFEDEDVVKQFRAAHDILRKSALEEEPSRDLIRKTARRHER
ncbi:helix-turn-helix domain-containing protein [Nocardia sp. NPDC051570]|uniref:helix-turn-helix domain-containing protein n=1 Tax=Nocardia sp. NPDC051570 TaxID=3364324 RepID=UPI00378852EF